MKFDACAMLVVCSLTSLSPAVGLEGNVIGQPIPAAPELASEPPPQRAPAPGAQRKAGEVFVEQASLTTPETSAVSFELGTVYVPENRSDPKSPIIGVGFARFKPDAGENTLNIAPFFPNGRVLIAIHGGHGVLEPIAEHLPDVMATLLEFLKTGAMSNVPARVTLPVPKFVVPDFPPSASKSR